MAQGDREDKELLSWRGQKPLTSAQQARRQALLKLSNATHLDIFVPAPGMFATRHDRACVHAPTRRPITPCSLTRPQAPEALVARHAHRGSGLLLCLLPAAVGLARLAGLCAADDGRGRAIAEPPSAVSGSCARSHTSAFVPPACLQAGHAWYKRLQRKDKGTRFFELYLLSIVNASIITGWSSVRTDTTQGGPR